MILLVLGVALVAGEVYEILRHRVSRSGEPVSTDWFNIVVPVAVLLAAWLRFPKERVPWLLFAIASFAALNRRVLALGVIGSGGAILIGMYLAAYGWRTRHRDRGAAKALVQFALWLALAVFLGLALHIAR